MTTKARSNASFAKPGQARPQRQITQMGSLADVAMLGAESFKDTTHMS